MKKLFGTDGVRGIANKELTCELAYKIGQAGAYVLTKGKDNAKIIIGKDTRISGDMLEAALVAGICSVGVDVECLGVIPTPAISYLTKKYKADAGVVISASHNPVEYNGIKFFSETGYKLSDKVELEIESYINGDKDKIELPFGDNVGVKKTNKQGLYDYENYIKNTIDIKLDGMKIALDCSEGAAYKCGPEVFESLGAEVYVIHNNPDGKNINKNCGSTHLEQIRKFTLANKCDIGLAFDGDADRCLAVDELGQDVDGDYIMTILANKLKNDGLLKNNTLVATVMSNMGLDIAMKELDIDVVKTQVGDKYVLEEMVAKGYKLGGEQSGHIIMLDYNTTGDGLLTAVKLAEAVKLSGQKFSQLKSTMKALPQILVNAEVPNDKKDIYLEDNEIKDMISRAEQTLDGKGRVLIRASGTEPLVRVMLEGENIEEITDMANEISDLIYNKSN